MNTNIVMDLHADFAAACANELQVAGYTPPIGPASDIILAYANVRHRSVEKRPRKVYQASYTVPAHLATGEGAFLAAVRAGDHLRPYQSTRIDDHSFDDGMLNDFGIQHFHLGTIPYPKNPMFMDRTDPLLFAVVRPDDFYAIGYYKHKEWTRKGLLDIIHGTWPTLLATATPHDAPVQLGFNPSDVEIRKLRRARINPITQRPDGTVHASPGGGAMSDGTSARVAADVIQVSGLCRQLERKLEGQLTPMIASGELTPPVHLHLVQRGNDTYAVIDGAQTEFKLGPTLIVPPL
jgi:hypothetical protein